MTKKHVYFFGDGTAEGNASKEMITLLGNKGAQLHEMTNMGLNVPPGFTLSTDVCKYYFENSRLPEGLSTQIREYVKRLETATGKKLGDSDNDPLLASTRSGAAISMPGMMETILNIGMTDTCVDAYRKRHPERSMFILDCYRRLLEMFGESVHGIGKEEFRRIFDSLEESQVPRLEKLITSYKELYTKHGKTLSQNPLQQLEEAVEAIVKSAMREKAINYRKAEGLPEKIYTGVTVQAMVYGNENETDCGTGVGFTRDPSTGAPGLYGEFLIGGQGEDIVAGRKNASPIAEMKTFAPEAYDELVKICDLLEKKTKRIQDFEFTLWKGRLYMLQTRNGKLAGRANVRSSCDMVKEGMITVEDAVKRISPEDLEQLLHKMIDYDAMKKAGIRQSEVLIGKGIPASPGAGVGKVVFDVKTAVNAAAKKESVVLCRLETNPADYPGMIVSEAIVTSRGGKTSHAAVVARNKGIPCTAGTGIEIDEEKKRMIYKNNTLGETVVIEEGDIISVDGSTGKVFEYEAALTEPNPNDQDLQDFLKLLYPIAKMRVFANANDAEEASRALRYGAEGIGLARTEYMFLEDKIKGENRALTIQAWTMAEDPAVKEEALQKLEGMQRSDFLEMYNVMKDKPIIIRLLDYPLHELLADVRKHIEELSHLTKTTPEKIKQRIGSFHERNPMLGHRSVRLGITHPEVYRMQVRAILTAAKEYNTRSEKYVTPHIEIPLVTLSSEVEHIARIAEEESRKLGFKRGGTSSKGDNHYLLGIMFELSGASFEAEKLAMASDFGSFGTNDLTQTTMGWSREDGNTTFLPIYMEQNIVNEDPFITIDKEGPVAKSMAHAVLLARAAKPGYEFGICGEHAADPSSLEVCHGIGLNNVSPGPNQVPIAWLRSAQLSLNGKHSGALDEYMDKITKSFEKAKS